MARLSTFLVFLMMVGCASSDVIKPGEGEALVTGTVTHRERMALPDDAVLEVWIADDSPEVLASPVVAQVSVLTDGKQVPLPFVLSYQLARIDAGRSYSVHAVIRHDGKVLYSSARPAKVITQGNPSSADLMLSAP